MVKKEPSRWSYRAINVLPEALSLFAFLALTAVALIGLNDWGSLLAVEVALVVLLVGLMALGPGLKVIPKRGELVGLDGTERGYRLYYEQEGYRITVFEVKAHPFGWSASRMRVFGHQVAQWWGTKLVVDEASLQAQKETEALAKDRLELQFVMATHETAQTAPAERAHLYSKPTEPPDRWVSDFHSASLELGAQGRLVLDSSGIQTGPMRWDWWRISELGFRFVGEDRLEVVAMVDGGFAVLFQLQLSMCSPESARWVAEEVRSWWMDAGDVENGVVEEIPPALASLAKRTVSDG